ncbi:hypothetical protein MBLNU230_g7383t1 [Neophaeotheca triangularis]
MPSPSTGALSPIDAAEETLQLGLHHLTETSALCLLKNIYGAMLLSAAGLTCLTLSTGFPAPSASNPALPHLLQGLTFPLGLILVYQTGAELYTGYPMWQTMTALSRKHKHTTLNYPRTLLLAWSGNLLGALLVSSLLAYATGSLTSEPHRSGIVEQIHSSVLEPRWHQIFFRAIGCGWLVTAAMFLGSQQHDGVSKSLALHLPFFVATAARWPHTVEYMFLGSVGMMVGGVDETMGVGVFLWKCLLPVTLGNAAGGAVTGAVLWWVFVLRRDDHALAKIGGSEVVGDGFGREGYRDEIEG